LASAAAVCLEERKHHLGAVISVRGHCDVSFTLHWPETTDQIRREWADSQEATEEGAVAIAIVLSDMVTDYHVIERAYKGLGFDYWLGKKTDFLLQNAARLEVSGIRRGDDQEIDARVKRKIKQTEQSRHLKLPAVVIVVEFGGPTAVVVMQ
jgi:hypothetical protein